MLDSLFSAVLNSFHKCNLMQYSLKKESSHNWHCILSISILALSEFYADHVSWNDDRRDSHYLKCVILNGHDTLYNATDEIRKNYEKV
jgi:hypothetical protein